MEHLDDFTQYNVFIISEDNLRYGKSGMVAKKNLRVAPIDANTITLPHFLALPCGQVPLGSCLVCRTLSLCRVVSCSTSFSTFIVQYTV